MLWRVLMASFAIYSRNYQRQTIQEPTPSEILKANITNHEKWDLIEEFLLTHKPFPFIVDL
jgi:hypothetical protein